MIISNDIRYLGVNDHAIDLFEGIYAVPKGMSYNSYAILDEKIAILDSVDRNFGPEWLSNIESALEGRTPDYLIVQHMEPDHSSNITAFMEAYPEATLVSNAKSFIMMQQFFGSDYSSRRIAVGDGDTLELGKHTLTFYTAPMVHWPEVIVTYDAYDKLLFSADAFGKFGSLDAEEDWTEEARRYYFGIVGKYGVQTQNLLKKIRSLEICAICPLHGPVLADDPAHYIALYDTWSSYRPESDGVVIAYTSVYGHTKTAVELLAATLESRGCHVTVRDLARDDMSEAVAQAFRCSKLVLATTTYNGDIFPFMKEFLHHLTERNFRSRTVGMIENGTWAPVAAKFMLKMLENSKDLTFTDNNVKIYSALNEESRAQLMALSSELWP